MHRAANGNAEEKSGRDRHETVHVGASSRGFADQPTETELLHAIGELLGRRADAAVYEHIERLADHPPGRKLAQSKRLLRFLAGFDEAYEQLPARHEVAEDRKSTRLNSSHYCASRMPSS